MPSSEKNFGFASIVQLAENCICKIQNVLECGYLLPQETKQLHEVIENQKKIQTGVNLILENPDFENVDQSDLLSSPWEMLGHGSFGRVFKAKLKGAPVAVKILDKTMKKEGDILRLLRHDNIVAYRGMAILQEEFKIGEADNLNKGSLMVIMEFVPNNLLKYLESNKTHEMSGLPKSQVWDFGKQIISGLYYLHSCHIAHGDLKPDNILLEKGARTLKLCDFGCAFKEQYLDSESPPVHNQRWTAPEFLFGQYGDCWDIVEIFKRADIFSYGLVLLFMLTGKKMWSEKDSTKVWRFRREKQPKISFPDLEEPLKSLCEGCCKQKPNERLSAETIVTEHFQVHEDNPYSYVIKTAEFFTCGFLKETNIVVADSLVDDEPLPSGEGRRPVGYSADCLECKVNVDESGINKYFPKHFAYGKQYDIYHMEWNNKAKDKIIDNNKTIALKDLKTPREGEEEEQRVCLQFVESTYVHHRAMRDVWMKLGDKEKSRILPCKTSVDHVFSTSFGLHVAVLTADEPKMFIFTRRANRGGMASPGDFTCGAVESCSIKDYVIRDGATYVQLIKTAARGLDEELGVVLTGKDLDAICLTTVYLKFDKHEWGMCGFVDLSDERIAPEHRLTYSSLKSKFTGGPKDKFEHDCLVAIPFELQQMIDFVWQNFDNFASSTKLVVVKVLQSFFGVAEVEKAFKARDSAS